MYLIFCFFFFSIFLSFLLFFFSLFFKKNNENIWSDLTFECGFEPENNFLPPFSLHFFSITIVFLIFDLEIVILIPLFITESFFFSFFFKLSTLILILLGLIIEWYDGSLDWEI